MHNEWVIAWATFGGKNFGNARVIARVCTKTINGLCGKGDQLTAL
jgi:hypothetical protein